MLRSRWARTSADAGIATVPNTNRRFLDSYEGADGIKTGFTNAAGFNLVASAERFHYGDFDLDDALSDRLLERYLRVLDSQRVFLLAADVAGFERLRERLDPACRNRHSRAGSPAGRPAAVPANR